LSNNKLSFPNLSNKNTEPTVREEIEEVEDSFQENSSTNLSGNRTFNENIYQSETLRTNNNNNNSNTNPNYYQNAQPKMTLNFDIQRPILDSSLPKYCYLKYLSRASVENWNQVCLYPYYQDFRGKNIFFKYRQKGIDFENISTLVYGKKNESQGEANESENLINFDSTDSDASNQDPNALVKCRVNLKFSTLDCYITPLALTALERFTEAIKNYQISPNSLITELEAKTQAHCASNSFKEAISKTQVSLKIPQIRLFSLQCGLAEGDRVSNAFIDTLANPDEFAICIHSIETELIDSATKTATVFKIDKIGNSTNPFFL
jgi:hypothetical protein